MWAVRSFKTPAAPTQRHGVTSRTTRTLDVTIVTEVIQHNRVSSACELHIKARHKIADKAGIAEFHRVFAVDNLALI
jgi:hypothetical protein